MSADSDTSGQPIANNNEESDCEKILTKLRQTKSLQAAAANKTDKRIWLQYIDILKELLRKPLSDAAVCYKESTQLFASLVTSDGFDVMIREKSVARENMFACIEGLNHPHFKTFLLLRDDQQKSSINSTYYIHVYLLLAIAAQSTFHASFTTNDDRNYFDNSVDLFTLLINRVDENMPDKTNRKEERGMSLSDINLSILSLLWNVADQTVLVPFLLQCDLGTKAVNWLAQANRLADKSQRPMISIVHNIARHDDGADVMNRYGVVDIIKNYQKEESNKTDARILVAAMALALLSTPEQLKSDKKGMNGVLNQLLQLFMDAAKADQYRHDGFHLSEPLAVMVKMFVVDERTLDYVLCHAEIEPPSDTLSTINVFIKLLFDFSHALKGTNRLEQFTLIAIFNVLWSISFQPNYAPILSTNEKLMSKIKEFLNEKNDGKLLDQYKPRSMEGIKEAAHGILHNLKLDGSSETICDNKHTRVLHALQPHPLAEKPAMPSIMISYCHENNAFCDILLAFLNTRKDAFSIWIDRTHCQGAVDLWESIAEGMEQASLILCLVSTQYFESKSCRKEFVYAADSLKKTIIPVLLENFEPKGWLGIRMPGLKYIRFRETLGPNQAKMIELLNTILTSLSTPGSIIAEKQIPPSHSETAPPHLHHKTISTATAPLIREKSTLRPLNQWKSDTNDVAIWFANNRISDKIRDLFEFETGDEMLNYGELVIKNREKQLDIYSKIFAEKYNGKEMPPHEFYRFATALEQLYKENRPSQFSNRNQSSTCTIL